MAHIDLGIAVFLLLSLAGGLFRILRGPTAEDRMLAAQLFGSTGAAILLVLGEAMSRPALRDVALVFVLLAAVNTAAFVAAREGPGGAGAAAAGRQGREERGGPDRADGDGGEGRDSEQEVHEKPAEGGS